MAKKSMKEELLKMLKSEMMGMKNEGKKDLFKDVLPMKEDMQKVTVMSDSPEGLEKGLTKAQQIMKAKLGVNPEKMDKEEKCPECDEMPCKCD